jgi:hypothetical protein
VGWRIRQKLSNEKWRSFPYRPVRTDFGTYSFEKIAQYFCYQGEEVAAHLFRGCFEATNLELDEGRCTENLPPAEWVAVRERYAKEFYRILSEGT